MALKTCPFCVQYENSHEVCPFCKRYSQASKSRPCHPDPGTEALATWLEAPDGGDRRPERVLVKGYYGKDSLERLEQVWFTTRAGEDLVHRIDNVLFEPLPSTRERLREMVSVYLSADVTALVDEILSRFDVSFKE